MLAPKKRDEIFPRTYETIAAFVEKFLHIQGFIKPEARRLVTDNPFTGEKVDLSTLIAYLVNEYVKFTDAVNTTRKELENNPDLAEAYERQLTTRGKLATVLSEAIAYLYASGLVDEGVGKQIEELRIENAKLKAEVAKWTSDYKELKEKYDFLDQLNSDKFRTDVKGGDSNGQH